MKKFIIIALMLTLSSSLYADPPELSTPAAPVLSQVFINPPTPSIEIEQYTEINIDEIKLRNALELEKAAMEYILAFEGYIQARKSKNPKVRARLVDFMKEYRNSYARFLALLRQDKLYHPQKPKNPAGWYNKKHKKTHGVKRNWKKTDAGAIRKMIKEMVKKGATPEEIKDFIKQNLPLQSMSSLPSTTCVPTANPCPPPSSPPPANPHHPHHHH